MHIRLTTAHAQVEIDPHLGASVISYRLSDGTDIFRPAAKSEWNAFRAACFPMVPWCNRIAGGVTDLNGQFHKIAPAHPEHPLPIHGSAALRPWKVKTGRGDELHLALSHDQPAPFKYDAEIHYHLSGTDLSIKLTVTNRADRPLPYGMGLHPWFPRTNKVGLRAPATHFQTVDQDRLPVGEEAISARPDWDFSDVALLPDDLIDTGFSGWDGMAVIGRDDGWGIEIRTNPPLECYQLYSPDEDSGFFCFEPVSHPINAHNMTGHPGLWPLDPGASASVTFTFAPTVDMLTKA
ncbi:MAG: aldose 1-epimerase [Pseudomonadota bacterium]